MIEGRPLIYWDGTKDCSLMKKLSYEIPLYFHITMRWYSVHVRFVQWLNAPTYMVQSSVPMSNQFFVHTLKCPGTQNEVEIPFFHTIVTQGPSIEDGPTDCPPWTNCISTLIAGKATTFPRTAYYTSTFVWQKTTMDEFSHGHKSIMDILMTGHNNIDLTCHWTKRTWTLYQRTVQYIATVGSIWRSKDGTIFITWMSCNLIANLTCTQFLDVLFL